MLQQSIRIARGLRKNQTPWEAKLWLILKNRNILGFKFRRQHEIGGLVVDFCCPEKMLIVELDGGHHNELLNVLKDVERQKFLEAHGYKFIRVWNNELDNNVDGVIEKIASYVGTPHLLSSPLAKGEEEKPRT